MVAALPTTRDGTVAFFCVSLTATARVQETTQMLSSPPWRLTPPLMFSFPHYATAAPWMLVQPALRPIFFYPFSVESAWLGSRKQELIQTSVRHILLFQTEKRANFFLHTAQTTPHHYLWDNWGIGYGYSSWNVCLASQLWEFFSIPKHYKQTAIVHKENK